MSPIAGFSGYANVTYKTGCDDVACKSNNSIFAASEAAKTADATIILAGLDLSVEAESLDREDLWLPGYQTQLINQVAEVAKGPVILVIMSAGGVDIAFAETNTNIKAILWAGYPGEEGGRAIADVVFGKFNPGGRLPITWYNGDYVQMLPLTSMPLRPVDSLGYPGRTYKFYNGPTLYPFGYGLSYTQFKYNLLSFTKTIQVNLNKLQHCRNLNYTSDASKTRCPGVLVNDLRCDDYFEFKVDFQNVGSTDGSDVVIVYSKPPAEIAATYIKQVIGFQRVFVRAGRNRRIKFVFNACKSLNIVDYAANTLLPAGEHTIFVGNGGVSFPIHLNFNY